MGYTPDLGNQDLRSLEQRGDVVYRAAGFHDPPTAEERATQAQIASGSSFELFAGAIAVMVTVVGIAGYFPLHMAAVATIAIGFSLIASGGALAARWQNATSGAHARADRTEALGIGTEVLGGFAGLALGVLALLGVAPFALLPAGMIVVGAALLFGGPAQPQIADAAPHVHNLRYRIRRDSVRTSSSVMVMAGLAGIVLGIAALAMPSYLMVLVLIAALCVSIALVVAGGTITVRFGRRFA